MITITILIAWLFVFLILLGISHERAALKSGLLPNFVYYKWASFTGFLFLVSLALTIHLHHIQQ